MQSDKPASHIPALDGVRGVAILLVLLLHFSAYGHGLPRSGLFIDQVYYRVAAAGWIGVDLFFVLSGFLITGILYDTRQNPHYFRNFYVRRTLRIFPLYYGALFLFLVILPRLWPDHGGLRSMGADEAWYWTYLSNVKIALDGWPQFGAIGHFWSLAVEEQFYLFWPLIVLALSRRHLQVTCVLCVVIALAVRVSLNEGGNNAAAFVLTPARIDALAVGAYIALAARGAGGLRRLARFALPAAALTSVLSMFIFVWRSGFAAYDPVVSTIGHTIIALLFGAVLMLVLTLPRDTVFVRAFDSTILRFFGRYSYGIYVFHHPLLFFMAGLVPLALIPPFLGSQLLRQIVFGVIATTVSVILALVSWHLWEKRFLALKVHFSYQSESPVLSRAPATQRLSERDGTSV